MTWYRLQVFDGLGKKVLNLETDDAEMIKTALIKVEEIKEGKKNAG